MRMRTAAILGAICLGPVGCGLAISPDSNDPDRLDEPRSARPNGYERRADAATEGTVARLRHSAPTSASPRDPRNVDFNSADPLVPAIELALDGAAEPVLPGGHSAVLPSFAGQAETWVPDFSSDRRAHFHPHGNQVCASGCAVSNHPTARLTVDEFKRLTARFAVEPMDETSRALDSLVYYGRQTQALLDQLGPAPLSRERAAFLRRELSRTHAVISFRVVDERGVVRTHLPPTRVPLDRRHMFEMEENGLQPLVTSGTVKRVGLDHLWTRL